jgi:hypothetical protein
VGWEIGKLEREEEVWAEEFRSMEGKMTHAARSVLMGGGGRDMVRCERIVGKQEQERKG